MCEHDSTVNQYTDNEKLNWTCNKTYMYDIRTELLAVNVFYFPISKALA